MSINATHQVLLISVNAMNASMLAIDQEKRKKKSILYGMAPKYHKLFKQICTVNIQSDPPSMPPTAKFLLLEKNPNHITNHLQSLTKNWKGLLLDRAFY